MSVATTPAGRAVALLKAGVRALAGDGQSGGEQPEVWLAPIEREMLAVGDAARRDLGSDLAAFAGALLAPSDLRGERESLRALVRQHYTCRLTPETERAFWAVPRAVLDDWRRRGVAGPRTPARALDACLGDVAEASRLGDLLDRHVGYAAMKEVAARATPPPRHEVAYGIAFQTIALAVERHTERAGMRGNDLIALERRREMLALLGATRQRRDHRFRLDRLARDLVGLLGADDQGREWERAMVTTINYAYNLLRLHTLAAQGARLIAHDVQPDACAQCQALLLWPDGLPRAFPATELWANIDETGGLNVGRRAGLPADQGGWVPGALQHPYCRCRPRRAKRPEIARYHAVSQHVQ